MNCLVCRFYRGAVGLPLFKTEREGPGTYWRQPRAVYRPQDTAVCCAAFLTPCRPSPQRPRCWAAVAKQNFKLAFRLDTKHQTGLQTGHKTSNWPSDWIQTIQLAFRLGTKHQMAFRGPSDWIQNIQLAFRLDTKHQIGLQTGNKTSNWPADWTTVWTPQCQILKPLCVKSRLEFMRKAINRQSTGNQQAINRQSTGNQ